MNDDELDRFKREIYLVQVAFSYGFSLAAEDNFANSKILRIGKKGTAGREKISVSIKSGVYVYINCFDSSDAGTVIDFIKSREPALNFGQIRKLLREFLSGSHTQHQRRQAAMAPTTISFQDSQTKTFDRAAMLAAWDAMPHYTGKYLEGRGLTPDIIAAFRVRSDDPYDNACFPHFDEDGLCGWEKKNDEFTGFSAGGNKALMLMSIDDQPTCRLIFTEASIDALSYSQLKYQPGDLYISTSGTPSARQLELIQLVLNNNADALIVLAHDADEAGARLAAGVVALAPPGARILRDRPPTVGNDKDWNDVLQRSLRRAPVMVPVLKSSVICPKRKKVK